MWDLTKNREAKVLSVLVLAYWLFFWLLNTVDKFIVQPTTLWKGKDRVTQFTDYFGSIEVQNESLVWALIWVVTVLETVAFLLMAAALVSFVRNRLGMAKQLFFWGTAVGIVIFLSFSIGDQVFGDRAELWEHGTFVMLILVSWFTYRFYNTEDKPVSADTEEVGTRSQPDLDNVLNS